ncbi:MAG: hypothetical protein RBS16_09720 [Candidatus Cloacimonadales bacterium]|nr:hypothetical protein [Candidatus Cloacimonadota bacterium]MDX9978291.1 hypothetical protein [Candidatus Cloacimonadales bacterium]
MDLLFLDTSFFWLILISFATLGIALIWVIPYYQVTIATLYNHVKDIE